MSRKMKKFIKNMEARVVPYTVIVLLCLAGLTSIFMFTPSTKAIDLPISWSGLYDAVVGSNDYQEGYTFKNGTSDYWYFYTDRSGWDLMYIRNTTCDGTSVPIFDEGSAVNSGVTECSYIFGVLKISGVMYIYWSEQGTSGEPINYAHWNGASWTGETDTGVNDDNRGGRVVEYDDGTNQYFMCSSNSGADDVRIYNSSDGTTWGNEELIYTDGTKPKLAVYDGDLYCFFYHDNAGSDGLEYKKYNATAGWTPSGTSNVNDVPGCPDTYEYNYPSACGFDSWNFMILMYSNQSLSNEPTYYRVYDDSGWSAEYLFHTDGSASSVNPQMISLIDNRLWVDTQMVIGDRDLYFKVYNFTGASGNYGIVDAYLDSGYVTWSGESGETLYSNATGTTGKNVTFYTDVSVDVNCTDVYIDLSGDITLGASNEIDFDSSSGNCEMYLQAGTDETWSDEWVQFTDANAYNISLDINWDSLSDDPNPFNITEGDGLVYIHCIFKLVLGGGLSPGTYLTSSSDIWEVVWKFEDT